MKPLSMLNEMHASKKLWQSNKSRETMLRTMDKEIAKDRPDSGSVVGPWPLLLDA